MTDSQRTTTTETEYPAPAVAGAPVTGPTTVSTSDTAYAAPGPGGATMATRLVTFAFGILQALLILRIVLLLLIANPGNDIVAAILAVTQPFVEPFVGMFALDRVSGDQGSVLDVAALVALVAWTLIEMLILAGIRLFSRRETIPA